MSEADDVFNAAQGRTDYLVATGMAQKPDDAAEAVRLSGITGVPATAINGDVEGFRTKAQTVLSQDLVRNSPALTNYVMSHPLAAAVSNDDWANLDKFSKDASFTQRLLSNLGTFPRIFERAGEEAFEAAKAPFEEPYKPTPYFDLLNFLSVGAHKVLEGGLSAIPAAALGAAKQTAIELGVDRNQAEAISDQLGLFLESQMAETPAAATKAAFEVKGIQEAQAARQKLMADMAEARNLAQPYIDAGMVPPVGLHPYLDATIHAASKVALESVQRDVDNIMASNTPERSTELARNFVVQQLGEGSVEVNGDVAAKLYGTKEPAPDDNLLGWVPDIASKLKAAREVGANFHVPIADWVLHAKANPEVEKALAEHLSVWPGGVTQAEAKEQWAPKAVLPEPHVAARGAAGAEPMFQVGDRRYTLARPEAVPFEEWAAQSGLDAEDLEMKGDFYRNVHKNVTSPDSLQILDDRGKLVGRADVSLEGNQLYINYIEGLGDYGPNSFGPALIRDLARQLHDLYPEAVGPDGKLAVTGHRVTGAREVAGTTEEPSAKPVVKLSRDLPFSDVTPLRDLLHDKWEGWARTYHGQGIQTYDPLNPPVEHELLARAVEEEVARMAGRGVEVVPAHKVLHKGTPVQGVYLKGDRNQNIPVIIYDLFSQSGAFGTAHHELIHYLRDKKFITDNEWARLEEQAVREDWIGKHRIDKRYSELRPELKLEEAIAEEFRHWMQNKNRADVSGVFGKLQELWERLKERFKQILGREDWEDTFKQIYRGDIAARGPRGMVGRPGVMFQKPDDLQMVRNVLKGLDQKSVEAIDRKIEARHKEDMVIAERRALEEQRRTQTKEWKENRAAMLEEVKSTLRQKADVAADLFVGSGELYGNKIRGRIPLRADDLTAEQKARLPDHYYAREGFPVEQAAHMFGYGSGEAMIDALAKYHADKGGLSPQEMFAKTAERVTDRQMEMKYGRLGTNIAQETLAQAFSETANAPIIEEYYAVAMQQGVKPPIEKADVKAYVKEQIGKQPISSVSSSRYIGVAGRFDNHAIKNLIGDKPAEALLALQRKVFNTLMAAEAVGVEQRLRAFAKDARRWAKRDITGVDPEAANFVHETLSRVGMPIQRTMDDLVKELKVPGRAKSLVDYATQRADMHRVLDVSDELLDPSWRKPFEQLTVDEFNGVYDTLKSLIHNGKEEKLIRSAGTDQILTNILSEEHIGRFAVHAWDANGRRWVGPVPPIAASALRTVGGALVQIENLLNRWDAYDPFGPLNQSVMRPLFEGNGRWQDLNRQFSKELIEAGDKVNLRAGVGDNDSPFINPRTDTPMSMNRSNLRTVMLNTGTPSNLAKMAGGYKTTPEAVLRWVNKYATKEDWEFVKKIWGIFAKVKKLSDTMYRELSGVPAKDQPTHTFMTPFGLVEGQYFPIMRHPLYEGKPRGFSSDDKALGDSFYSVSSLPSADYTKDRTRDVRPLALDLEQLPGHLGEMLRDIAMRPALIDASKIFFNEKFRKAISARFGQETTDLLIPYLRDVAGTTTYMPGWLKMINDASEFFRRNEVASLIGYNVGTMAKHGLSIGGQSAAEVGPINFSKYIAHSAIHPIDFLRAFRGMFSGDEAMGDSNAEFVMRNSAILRGRHSSYQQSLTGATSTLLPSATGVGLVRQKLIQYATTPIALVDFMSAFPTWEAAYWSARDEGKGHDDAVYLAERAVRRSHGDASVVNRAAVLDVPWLRWMTSLYNVFSHMYNRSLESIWRGGEALKLVGKGDRERAKEVFAPVPGYIFAYSIMPALVEHMISGQPASPNEPEWEQWAKAFAYTEGAKVPVVRDLVHWLLTRGHGGGDPAVGLATEAARSSMALVGDIFKKEPLSANHAQHIIRDAGAFLGLFYGAPQAPFKAGAFEYGREHGAEPTPKGPLGWMSGLRYGTLKGHSSTLDNYLAGRPY